MAPRKLEWTVGELRDGDDPVLIRHRISHVLDPNSGHDWLAIVTHHLASVQANGLPDADYNDSLQDLDQSVIKALERGRGDKVFLVETCHGKRHYYAYVRGFEAVGQRIQKVIEDNSTYILSYRIARDPKRLFINEYMAQLGGNKEVTDK